ncbi:LamG domain-containing protein, partial [Flavobacteriales bacterium]|nr:LamG domain-containing protein [Flavobacteriales bacterium]
ALAGNNINGQVEWGTGNIDSAPQFVDSANGNYNLVPGSPGVDAGNPDLNRNGIPWQNDPEDQDPDGTRMDMGYGYAAQGPVVNFNSPIISNASGDITYAWSTGETTPTINPTPTVTTTYYVTVNNGINFCQDSITVTVLPTSAITIDTAVCDSMFFAGNNITTSGLYYDTLTNSVGCDSVVTLDLTIHNSIATNDSAVDCDNYTWNGNVYDTSGIYVDTLQTFHGCDSIVTMDLTINYSFYAEESITACDSMTWDNGITYTQTGIYYDSLLTNAGCDSVYKLDLTINPSPDFSFTQDTLGACGGDSVLLDAGSGHTNYLWNTGDTTQTIYASATGTYSVTVGNGTVNSGGNSLEFDGQDDYVIIGDSISLADNSFTLTAWVRKDGRDSTNAAIVMSSGNGSAFNGMYFGFNEQNGSDRLFFNFYNPGTELYSTDSLNIEGDNQWHHIAASYNNSNNEQIIYLDGINVGSQISVSSFKGSGSFALGITSWNFVDDFTGKIDEAVVWNTALSQSEIQDYMNCPPSGNEAGLVGYWNMDEGNGTTLTDLSGNGNDGTINGATWSDNTPTQICDNCTTSDSIYVEILDVDIVQNDTTICQGDSVELSVVSSSNGSASLGGSLNNGLVAYYPFNGNANDESGNGNDGINSGATLTSDRFGNADAAYDFDGSTNYITVNNVAQSNNSPRSIFLWVNYVSDTNHQAVVSTGSDQSCQSFNIFANYNNSYGNLGFMGYNPCDLYGATNNMNDGQWHHIGVTYDSAGILRTYFDGLFEAQSSFNLNTTGQNNFIGRSNHFPSNLAYYEGTIDDVVFWNRALTQQEIQELYSSQSSHSYAWSNGESNETILVAPTQTTTYYVTASNSINSCQDSVTVN